MWELPSLQVCAGVSGHAVVPLARPSFLLSRSALRTGLPGPLRAAAVLGPVILLTLFPYLRNREDGRAQSQGVMRVLSPLMKGVALRLELGDETPAKGSRCRPPPVLSPSKAFGSAHSAGFLEAGAERRGKEKGMVH